jgi:hydrogenase maturation protease
LNSSEKFLLGLVTLVYRNEPKFFNRFLEKITKKEPARKNLRTLLIGYGNTLREDDGFGAAVARKAARRLSAKAGFEAISATQLTIEMSEKIAGYDRVIFADLNIECAAGILAVPIARGYDANYHALSPWGLLRIAREFYGFTGEVLIFSAGAASLGYKEKPTPLLQKRAREVAEFLESFI